MTPLGTAYLVMGSLALLAVFVHLAQALLVRNDPVHAAVAAACAGFSMYGIGWAVTAGTPQGDQPVWGLVGIGLGVILAYVFVPVTAWTLLEVPLTRTRGLIIVIAVAVGGARLAEILVRGSARQTGSQTLFAAGVTGIAIATVWTVESIGGIRRRTPFAPAMVAFGALSVALTTQGLLNSMGWAPGPDLFGFAAVPFIAFVNTLSTLRYVHALQHANQPAGD